MKSATIIKSPSTGLSGILLSFDLFVCILIVCLLLPWASEIVTLSSQNHLFYLKFQKTKCVYSFYILTCPFSRKTRLDIL